MSKYNLVDIFEGFRDSLSSEEKERFDSLSSDDQDKIEKIKKMMDLEKSGIKEGDAVDLAIEASQKKAGIKEVRIDKDVADRIEGLTNIELKRKFLFAFEDLYSDLTEEDPFHAEDVINHLNNEMHKHLKDYQDAGGKLEEDDKINAAAGGLENIINSLTKLSKEVGPMAVKAKAMLQGLAKASHSVRETSEEAGLPKANIGLAYLEETGYEDGEKAVDMYFNQDVIGINSRPDFGAYRRGFVQSVMDNTKSFKLGESENQEFESEDDMENYYLDLDSVDEGKVSMKDVVLSIIKDTEATNPEVQMYIDSLTNDIKLNGKEAYADYEVDDYIEDFKEYISNKSLQEHFGRFMKDYQ